VLPVPAAHDMQRLLVWAFIGRHFTSTLQDEVQGAYFFEFNVASRTLALRKIQCEFEKPVYVSMIVVTIVVLIFIMASRLLHRTLAAEAAPLAAPDPTHAVSTAMAIGLRYRPVPLFAA